MNALRLFGEIALSAVTFVVLIYVGVRLVRYAKTRTAGAYALGAVLVLFGIGNIREPDNQLLEQAQPGKKKGSPSGSPFDE
jgi:hypothetical protein